LEEEYELEKRVSRGGGDRRSEEAIENQSGKNYHIDPEKTSEKIAKEHNISEKTVRNSADLFRSHQAVIATSKPISLLQDEYIPWPA